MRVNVAEDGKKSLINNFKDVTGESDNSETLMLMEVQLI